LLFASSISQTTKRSQSITITSLETNPQTILPVKLESKFRRARAATLGAVFNHDGVVVGIKHRPGRRRGSQVHIYLTTQFGGGRELLSAQFSGVSFQSINPTAEGSQFSGELFLQTTNGGQIIRIQTECQRSAEPERSYRRSNQRRTQNESGCADHGRSGQDNPEYNRSY
jgi:hypothetical protein